MSCKDLGLRDDQLFDMMDLQDLGSASQAGSTAGSVRHQVVSGCATHCMK